MSGVRQRHLNILDLDPAQGAIVVDPPPPQHAAPAAFPAVSVLAERGDDAVLNLRDTQKKYSKQRAPRPHCSSFVMIVFVVICLSVIAALSVALYVKTRPTVDNAQVISANVVILTDLLVSRKDEFNNTISNMLDVANAARPFVMEKLAQGAGAMDVLAGFFGDQAIKDNLKMFADKLANGDVARMGSALADIIDMLKYATESANDEGFQLRLNGDWRKYKQQEQIGA